MKLSWLLIPIALAGPQEASSQMSNQQKQPDLRPTTLTPFVRPDTLSSAASSIPTATSTPIMVRTGLVPATERYNLRKPAHLRKPSASVAATGPLRPNDRKHDKKALPAGSLTKPLDPPVTIAEAWWDNEEDYDGDGFKQSARLVWDPDAVRSLGSVAVYEKVYYKLSSDREWGLASITPSHTIAGTSSDDAYSLQINGAPHGLYDWRIDVYRVGQLTPDDSRDPSLDRDLDGYALEYPGDDATATIYDAWWTNEQDMDKDGYKSMARLVWDADVAGSTDSLRVHEEISRRLSGTQDWIVFGYTETHTIVGNTTDDQWYADIVPVAVEQGLYDFKIEIYREGITSADDVRDHAGDADLHDYGLEGGRDDGLRARIAEVWWSDNVDNDGDGYKQHTALHWDADVVGATGCLFAVCRIYFKPSDSTRWAPFINYNVILTGDTRDDAVGIGVRPMPHGLYDWKIEVYSDPNAVPDVVRQPSNEHLLGGFAMELPEEDGTTAVHEPDLSVPLDYALMQNYPNPFNPFTRIKYTIGGAGGSGSGPSDRDSRSREMARPELGARNVQLRVYDLLGREVAVLVNERKAPGTYEVDFSAKGGSASGGDGGGLASGVYIYRISAGDFVATKTMILVK
jgi:hypothetical protein